MIEVHTSTVYGQTMEGYERIDLLREGVDMMVEYGDATVISEDTDGDTSYDALVGVGGDIVYRITLASGQFLTIRKGRMVSGEFQYDTTYSNLVWSNVQVESSQFIRMRVINGGAVWDLQFYLRSVNVSTPVYRQRRIRVAHITSGLDNSERVSGSLYDANSSFPTAERDQVLIGGNLYGVGYISPDYPQSNVDPNDIILFPALVYLPAVGNGLGVPTIGGEAPYYIGKPSGVTLNPYTEFQVNGGRYISLGNVAIRSR